MSRAQSLFRRFGRLALPLEETSEDSLVTLDPARDILLDCFAAALNAELEPVWERAVRGTPLQGVDPVAQKLPSLPSEETMQQMKAGFPLLAVGRSIRPWQVEPWSIEQDKLTTLWDVDYVLGPLALTNTLRLQDVLQFVGKTLTMVVRQRGHKAYLTRQSGAQAFTANVLGDDGEASCGFYSCDVTEFSGGPASFAKDKAPNWLACGMTLKTVEVSTFLPGDEDGESVPLVGASLDAGLTQSGDPAIRARA